MEPTLDHRKREEIELHDALRGRLKDDKHFRSNEKFYSIATQNVDIMNDWIRSRCAGRRALDYCCGDGPVALMCAEAGANAVGIDISPVSVDAARENARRRGLSDRTAFHVMDAEALQFGEREFDLAVVSGVLHHLDLNKAYGELARVLKPEGQVICLEALRHNPVIHLYRKLTPHLRTPWEVDHILTKRDIYHGRQFFERVEVLGFFHLATLAAVPFRKFPGFRALRKALESIDAVLLRLPVVKWQAWMTVFTLSNPRRFTP